jgi:hypothetical protein
MCSLVRKRSHDNHRSVELAFDSYLLPIFLVQLISRDIAELNNGVSFDGRLADVLVKILLGEVLPFTAIDLECPFSGSIAASFGTVELKDMITSIQSSAEVQKLSI